MTMKPKLLKHDEIPLRKLGDGVTFKILADEEEGVENLGMGWILFEPGATSSMHTREVEEFIYVIKGETTILLESGEKYVFGPRDFIFIPAGVTHQHINSGTEDLEQIYIFAPQGPEKPLRDSPIVS